MSLWMHRHPILIFFLFYKPDHWLFIQATLEPNPVVATNGIAMESHEETQNRILPILCEWLTMSLWMHRHPILIFFLFYKPDHWLFIQATLEPNPVVATNGIAMESHEETQNRILPILCEWLTMSLWMHRHPILIFFLFYKPDHWLFIQATLEPNPVVATNGIATESHKETQNRILPILCEWLTMSLWMHRHPILIFFLFYKPDHWLFIQATLEPNPVVATNGIAMESHEETQNRILPILCEWLTMSLWMHRHPILIFFLFYKPDHWLFIQATLEPNPVVATNGIAMESHEETQNQILPILCEWLTMSLWMHRHPILIFFLFYKPDHWLFIQATLEPNPVVATNGIAMESHEETQNWILPILCEWLTMSLWMHRHPILIFFLFYKPDHWLFIQATLEPNPVVATNGIAMESHEETQNRILPILCEWLTMSLWMHRHPILIFFLFYKPDHWLFIQATLEPNPVVATNGIAMESHEETQNRILPILCEWLTMSLWMHRHPILIFFLFYKPDHWLFIQATLEPNPVVATNGIAMESHEETQNRILPIVCEWLTMSLCIDTQFSYSSYFTDQTIDCSSKQTLEPNPVVATNGIAMESHKETQNRILPILCEWLTMQDA